MVFTSFYPDIYIPEISLSQKILQKIEQYGDAVALVDTNQGKSLTFKQVYDQVKKCGSALYKRGLRKGDVVCLCTPNCVEYPIIFLAVTACGAIITTCNPLYGTSEMLQQFNLSQPQVIFCDCQAVEKIKIIAEELPSLKQVYTIDEMDGMISYDTLVNADSGADFPQNISIDAKEDILVLPYSSGTTGLPKGVMLTNYNLVSQILITSFTFNMSPSNCFYMVVPMFHTFGFTFAMFCLHQGVKDVFDTRFDVERVFKAIQTHKVSHISAVPPIMLAMAQSDLDKKYDTSSLKRMISGAAPIAPELVTTIQNRYNIIVSTAYGLTEGVPLSSADPVTNDIKSVGMICPNISIKIIDIETGKELGPNQDGEICAKGPLIMKGYWKNPKATAHTIDSEGWLHSGDIGHCTSYGMVYVVDRLKELIKYKGFQVAPAELESTLLEHPKIRDAAVIGIPNKGAGEIPKAYVVKNDYSLTENEVIGFIEGKLASYKHLRGGVQFVESVPRTPSGKILRKDLRKMHVHERSNL